MQPRFDYALQHAYQLDHLQKKYTKLLDEHKKIREDFESLKKDYEGKYNTMVDLLRLLVEKRGSGRPAEKERLEREENIQKLSEVLGVEIAV